MIFKRNNHKTNKQQSNTTQLRPTLLLICWYQYSLLGGCHKIQRYFSLFNSAF